MAGLTIDDGKEKPMSWTSDRRLYLTPDGEVSEEPVSGGRLLVGRGGQLSNEDAERYGLTGTKAEKRKADKGRKGLEDKSD